jgi:hypothetical protein
MARAHGRRCTLREAETGRWLGDRTVRAGPLRVNALIERRARERAGRCQKSCADRARGRRPIGVRGAVLSGAATRDSRAGRRSSASALRHRIGETSPDAWAAQERGAPPTAPHGSDGSGSG